MLGKNTVLLRGLCIRTYNISTLYFYAEITKTNSEKKFSSCVTVENRGLVKVYSSSPEALQESARLKPRDVFILSTMRFAPE